MYHKPEVYMTIRHPFTLAWREFVKGASKDVMSAEALYARYKVEIADEVVKHAHLPSMASPKAIRQMAIKPWQKPSFTKDDGIDNMSVQQIMRICLDWLKNNEEKTLRTASL